MAFEELKKNMRLAALHQWHIFKSKWRTGTIEGDRQDLAALHGKACRLWAENPFSYDPDAARGVLAEKLETLLELCRKSDKVNSSYALEAIVRTAFFQMLGHEPTFVSPPLTPASFDTSSLQKQEKDRRRLAAYVMHNSDIGQTIEQWSDDVHEIFFQILSRLDLPDSDPQEPASIFLQSELLHLSQKQGEIMQWCFEAVRSQSAEKDYFFRAVMTRITENFNHELGIKHHKTARVEFHEYFLEEPTTGRARVLLAGTPFEPFLLSSLPLPVSDHYRYSHTHVLGGTGAGKTQLLQQMILSDLSRPPDQIPSMVIIDSQGDMLEKIKRLAVFARGNLSERLLVIDPTDQKCPPQLNLFDYPTQSDNSRIQERDFNALMETFDFIFAGLLGTVLSPRQQQVFRFLSELMAVIPGATILTLKDVLEDPEKYREDMERTSPLARGFLLNQYLPPPNSRTGGKYAVTRDAILSRLYLLMQNPAFLRMFGATKNRLDLYGALQEEGKIVLVHTDKDFLQPSVSSMFGRYIIAMVFKAVMQRAPLAEDKRRPTFLYVDEASEYFDSSMKNLLEQARKYKLGMIFAHQTLSQISREADKSLASVVHGNTSVKITAGIEVNDAKVMAANMRTSAEYIMEMKSQKGVGSDFAIFVKTLTPQAMRYRVDFGTLENAPQISQQDYDFNVLRSQLAFGCGDGQDGAGSDGDSGDGDTGQALHSTVPKPSVSDAELEARFAADEGEQGYTNHIQPNLKGS